MSLFQAKTIKFLGKNPNSAAVEVLVKLLVNPDNRLRTLAFEALFLRKEQALYVLLFKYFVKDEEFWTHQEMLTPERLSRIADAAFRSDTNAVRQDAARAVIQYKLYESVPTVLMYLEGKDDTWAKKAQEMILQLSELFYSDLLAAPESERRNFDNKREWFVQQLDGPIKR
jgi:HEAT repeat protein